MNQDEKYEVQRTDHIRSVPLPQRAEAPAAAADAGQSRGIDEDTGGVEGENASPKRRGTGRAGAGMGRPRWSWRSGRRGLVWIGQALRGRRRQSRPPIEPAPSVRSPATPPLQESVSEPVTDRWGVRPVVGAAGGRFHFHSEQEIMQLPRKPFLVNGVLPEGDLAVMIGAPGACKSLLSLDICLSIATGAIWSDQPVMQRPVVYVAAERFTGQGPRVRAWREGRPEAGPAAIGFVGASVNLLDPVDVAEFIQALCQLSSPPALIVIDTLARCFVGGDENSARDMGVAVRALDRIRAATGATVLVLHHTRKGSNEERGSSALRGAADVILTVKRDRSRLTLACSKMSDGPDFAPLCFDLHDGDESCYLLPAPATEPKRIPHKSDREMGCLAALAAFSTGATFTAWLAATNEAQPAADRLSNSSFGRVRDTLLERGWVAKKGETGKPGTLFYITEEGHRALP